MVTPELLDFIRQCKAKGQNDSEIKASILNQGAGWTEQDLIEVFNVFNINQTTPSGSIPASSIHNLVNPEVNNLQNNYISPDSRSNTHKSRIGIIVFVSILILLIGGGVYAWQAGLIDKVKSTFVSPSEPISKEKFLSNIIENITKIKTVNFRVAIEGLVNDRDVEAVSYQYDENALVKKGDAYARDLQRIDDIQKILMAIKYNAKSGLPQSISDLEKNQTYYKIKSKDPSGINYQYNKMGAQSFLLSMILETDEAVDQLRKYNNRQTSMPGDMQFTKLDINGRKVTFTEKSDTYFYISRNIPEPILVSMLKSMKSVPASSDMTLELGVKVDSKYKGDTNWQGNLDLNGVFDDFAIAFGAKAQKVDSDYFLIIEKFPSIFFLSMIAPIKGKWIKFSESDFATSSGLGGGMVSSIGKGLFSAEKTYKESNPKDVELVKKA